MVSPTKTYIFDGEYMLSGDRESVGMYTLGGGEQQIRKILG
jgi:hypothetical protein